jgi:phage-related minor tail protein
VLKGLEQDILRIIMRKAVTEPLGNAIGGMFSSIFSNIFPSANGNVFTGAPALSAYSGSVVSRPTVFPFANGIGLMGEAGAEAILPLRRGADGKLGVAGGGSAMVVNIIEAPGNGGKTEQRQDNNGANILDVYVEKIKSSIAGDISQGKGPIPGALAGTYGLNRAVGAY